MIQFIIVALIVAFCAWQVMRKFWPKKAAAVSVSSGGGCGTGGCETCGACKAISFDIPKER